MEPHVCIVGADEVGRGCVFGPLVIAAVANVMRWTDGEVTDSKRVKSEKRRNAIAARIREHMVWNVVSVPVEVINHHGLAAALDAGYVKVLQAVIDQISAAPWSGIKIVIDGLDMPQISRRYNGGITSVEAVVKADLKVFEVGAASLVAKVTRDNWVHEIVKQYPTLAVYDLDQNKGYGTPKHTAALFKHGLSRWHRPQACQTLMETHKEKTRGTCRVTV